MSEVSIKDLQKEISHQQASFISDIWEKVDTHLENTDFTNRVFQLFNAELDRSMKNFTAEQRAEIKKLRENFQKNEDIFALAKEHKKQPDILKTAFISMAVGESVAEFKASKAETIKKRPTTKRVEDGVSSGEDIDQLKAQLDRETDPVEKKKIASRISKLRDN